MMHKRRAFQVVLLTINETNKRTPHKQQQLQRQQQKTKREYENDAS